MADIFRRHLIILSGLIALLTVMSFKGFSSESYVLVDLTIYPVVTIQQPDVSHLPAEWQAAYSELLELGYREDQAVRLHRLTAYNAVAWQTNNRPFESSCGLNQPDQLAISRDLFFDDNGNKHLCGERVKLLIIDPVTREVTDVQERVIWDTMNGRFQQTGDVLLEDVAEARRFGVRQGLLVFVDAG
jgi:hypothetical protein